MIDSLREDIMGSRPPMSSVGRENHVMIRDDDKGDCLVPSKRTLISSGWIISLATVPGGNGQNECMRVRLSGEG
jgi:hypothetical protein